MHTVMRNNGYNDRIVRRKLYINKINRKRRLTYSKDFVQKSQNWWKVLFLLMKINIVCLVQKRYSMAKSKWKFLNFRLNLKSTNLKSTFKYGDGVNVWRYISSAGVVELMNYIWIFLKKIYRRVQLRRVYKILPNFTITTI